MGLVNGIFDTLLSLGSGAGYLGNTGSSRVQTRLSNKLFPVNLLGEGEYKEALRLGWIKKEQYFEYMRELGFSENQAKIAYANTKSHLTALELVSIRIAKQFELVMSTVESFETGDVTKLDFTGILADYYAGCYKIGYDKNEADKLFESNRPIPTKSDIDQFMNKEVFEKETYQKFKMDQELPPPYERLMKSLGIPDEEILAYWIAHWNHPSPLQIMEMYQRFRPDRNDRNEGVRREVGVEWDELEMTSEDVNTAMKLHEQAPFWPQKFKAIGFRNLNLTALQGGYVYGLKPDSWFKGRLRDNGLSEEDAEFQLEVWRRKFPYASKAPLIDNTFQQIIKSNVTRDEALALLGNALNETRTEYIRRNNLDKDETINHNEITTWYDYYVDTAIDKRYLNKERRIIRTFTNLYKKKVMTDEELKRDLIKAGVNEEYIPEIMLVIKASSYDKTKTYTTRDVSRALNSRVITKDEAIALYMEIYIDADDAEILANFYFRPEINPSDE